ncbi:MAG: von Willebrand factor type A domain-containing protein [Clostridia bacterium]|nr:von Willebrand factor type A domain-containing protein [Clostridia bacterium]
MFILSAVASGCSKTATSEAPAMEESKPSVDTSRDEAAEEKEVLGEFQFSQNSKDYTDSEAEAVYPNEGYDGYRESEFTTPMDDPLSTLSIDVDTASYSNIRRYLSEGMLPPVDAVRVEECINYFSYDYPQPDGKHPLDAYVTISTCPWNEDRYLARVAIQGEFISKREAGPSNLVFLLDVSGSMNDRNKLPLVKSAMELLSDNLSEDDKVSIVVYAGASGVVLEGCDGDDTKKIERALDKLSAGGSTAGGAGIELAYEIAEDNFIEGGNNRVILCTDGDFNVGPSSTEELEKLIEEKRDGGVFLSVLGFGTGNVKDNMMETLADKGNGNYAYIDNLMEAKKVLIDDMTSTLYTIAKDVKIQVEFNPEAIKEYRLIGYDNRLLNPEDFNDDKKDAGEVGAGHSVTVFYELILTGTGENSANIDDLIFQDNEDKEEEVSAFDIDEWMYVKIRYKLPDEDESKLFTKMAGVDNFTYHPDDDFLFASAVAEFALLLKDSEYASDASYDSLIERAKESKGDDEFGYRAQFIQLADMAKTLDD